MHYEPAPLAHAPSKSAIPPFPSPPTGYCSFRPIARTKPNIRALRAEGSSSRLLQLDSPSSMGRPGLLVLWLGLFHLFLHLLLDLVHLLCRSLRSGCRWRCGCIRFSLRLDPLQCPEYFRMQIVRMCRYLALFSCSSRSSCLCCCGGTGAGYRISGGRSGGAVGCENPVIVLRVSTPASASGHASSSSYRSLPVFFAYIPFV